MKKIIANIISIVFSPPLWIIFFLILAFYKKMFDNSSTQLLLLLLILFLIPILSIYFLYKKRIITHIDMINRKERLIPLLITNICVWMIIYVLNHYSLLLLISIFKPFAILLFFTSIITLYYKISIHMIFTVYFTYVIISTSGYWSYMLYLTIPAIFLSRLYLKRHTIGQLLLAFILTLTIISLHTINLI